MWLGLEGHRSIKSTRWMVVVVFCAGVAVPLLPLFLLLLFGENTTASREQTTPPRTDTNSLQRMLYVELIILTFPCPRRPTDVNYRHEHLKNVIYHLCSTRCCSSSATRSAARSP